MNFSDNRRKRSDNHALEAIFEALQIYPVSSDQNTVAPRRNLFFAVSLAFTSLTMSINPDGYSVNLGIIAGQIENAAYIYVGLLLGCLYQLCHFWILCQAQILKLMYENVGGHTLFVRYIASIAAKHAFGDSHKIKRNEHSSSFAHNDRDYTIESGDYKTGQITVCFEIQRVIIDNDEILHADIMSDDNNFGLLEGTQTFYRLSYTHQVTPDDIKYYMAYKNIYLVHSKLQIIECVLPLVVGLIASYFLISRVIDILCLQ